MDKKEALKTYGTSYDVENDGRPDSCPHCDESTLKRCDTENCPYGSCQRTKLGEKDFERGWICANKDFHHYDAKWFVKWKM